MPGTNLTRQEAADRSALIDVQSYDVTLDLADDDSTFASHATVRFTATPGAHTFIDFIGDRVDSATLNGTQLDVSGYDGARISLPGLAETNELIISGRAHYMNTGEGLHRFVDPVDDAVYLYSQFEVADCRRVFPVFEQPDLKATFAFTITAPSDWTVLSNETGTPTDGPRANTKTWDFPATPRIACYITAICAGPYAEVRDCVTTRAGEIPLGLYCRASLAEHLDADNFFDITKAGFAFFEEEFDQPYPFSKYDQIIAPEFNAGAMENAGCVTFAETYLFRGRVPDSVVEARAATILHELAHMWFGNLVTMTWWDDLWLNESFAEWACTTAASEATQFTDAWTTFATSSKAWAYKQDQLSSTHPVVADMNDLEDVENNFDGITYAKGASVLKQLVAYVGRDAFRTGLRRYFAKHAWGSTKADDLMVELEAASGRDLGPWRAAWLESSGVGVLRPQIEVDDAGTITQATLLQEGPDGIDARPHRLAVGCYSVQDGAFVRTERIETDVTGPETDLSALVGKPRPDVILVNDDDLAYAKMRLDEQSMAAVLAHPEALVDSLPRTLVLASAWSMTWDGQMRARDYTDLALRALALPLESALTRQLLAQITQCVRVLSAPDARHELRATTADRLRDLVHEAKPGSDAQLQLVTAYANLARSDEHADTIQGFLDGTLEGLAVDADMRWTLLTSLAAQSRIEADVITAERDKDGTATGRERAARALAARPTAQAKDDAWTEGVTSPDTPNQMVTALALGFGDATNPELLVPYIERYHDALRSLWETRTVAMAQRIIAGFYPIALAGPHLQTATDGWLEAHHDAPGALRRCVAEQRDLVVRAVAAQERDAQQ